MGEREQNVWVDDNRRIEQSPAVGDSAGGQAAPAGPNFTGPAAGSPYGQNQAGQLYQMQPLQAGWNGGQKAGEMYGSYAVVQGKAPSETEETKLMKKNYGVIAPAALAYAVFYTFCMYRNDSGITYPFFVAASVLFFAWSWQSWVLTERERQAPGKSPGACMKKPGLRRGVLFILLQ